TNTSHRAGSIRWMAPELIDPDSFGGKFLRTPATDVYAFGCVFVNGDRPQRPSAEPLSDALWNHVNNFWAQDSRKRP
ncbi:hypothetical protein K438DRAFT_1514487, partial [Mycena galopus ATCC 62051]